MSDRGGGDWRQHLGWQRLWDGNFDSRQSPMLEHGR
jgi:hypothetical protein